MQAARVYHLLQEACREMESSRDFAIAAVVSQAMALINAKYGVGKDHLDEPSAGDHHD